MCLERIDAKYFPNCRKREKVKKGYKVYTSYNSRGYNFLFGNYKVGKKYESNDYGFHIFLNKNKAISVANKWNGCVVEVNYSHVLQAGIDFSSKCVTANFMTLKKRVYTSRGWERINA